jgi:hypothetical protein
MMVSRHALGHDQASGAGPDGLLDEPVEGAAQLHQAHAFFLEHLPDCPVLDLRVRGPLCVGDALIFQPPIQFGGALHPPSSSPKKNGRHPRPSKGSRTSADRARLQEGAGMPPTRKVGLSECLAGTGERKTGAQRRRHSPGAGTENEAATSSKKNPAAGGAGGGVFNGRLAKEG